MLTMLLIGIFCKWSQKENSSENLSAYCSGNLSCSRTEKSSKLKCSERTLDLMKLHRRWLIRCSLCILNCFSVKEKEFWYMYIYMFGYYYEYHSELCYKSPIRGMIIMFVMLALSFQQVVIVNITLS